MPLEIILLVFCSSVSSVVFWSFSLKLLLFVYPDGAMFMKDPWNHRAVSAPSVPSRVMEQILLETAGRHKRNEEVSQGRAVGSSAWACAEHETLS